MHKIPERYARTPRESEFLACCLHCVMQVGAPLSEIGFMEQSFLRS